MSAIDPTKPTAGTATTESVRLNFQAAKDEIDALNAGKQTILAAYTQNVPPQLSNHSGRVIIQPNVLACAASTTTTVFANRLYCTPFVAPASGTIDSIFARVTTGAAGNMRIGLYRPTASGILLPAALVADTGDLSTAAAATIGAAVNTSVSRGELMFAAFVYSAGPTMTALSNYAAPAVYWDTTTTLTGPQCAIYKAFTYAALPADLSGSTWTFSGTTPTSVGIRYA